MFLKRPKNPWDPPPFFAISFHRNPPPPLCAGMAGGLVGWVAGGLGGWAGLAGGWWLAGWVWLAGGWLAGGWLAS